MSKTDLMEARRALRRKKRDRKGGGFFWLWNKIRSALGLASEEAGTGGALSGGGAASSAASQAAQALEAGEGLARVSVLSPQEGSAASSSSVWGGRAVMAAAAIGVVAAGVLGLSHRFSNSSSQAGPHFGPIASLIHIFRPQYGASNANSSGNSGLSGNLANASSQSSGNLSAQGGAKTGNSGAAKNSGKTAAFPSAFNGLPSAKLSTDLNDGGPVAAQALKEAGQAAQEAALVKNGGFSPDNKIAVTPMIATPLSPYLVAGVSVGSKGRGFSRSFGGLRGMSEYVHPMDTSASGCASGDSSCDSAAGNAINQWQNAPIVNSGQGISMGGADAGTADNPPAPNPTGSGGGAGSGAQGTALAGDISNVCSADQIQKGYISSGNACVPGFSPGGTNASPWQNDLQTANMLIETLSGMMFVGSLLLSLFWSLITLADSLGPFGAALDTLAAFVQQHIEILGGLVLAMAGYVIYLSTKIGAEGGHWQALNTGIVGGMLAAGAGILMTDNMAFNTIESQGYLLLSLAPLAMMITTLLGIT